MIARKKQFVIYNSECIIYNINMSPTFNLRYYIGIFDETINIPYDDDSLRTFGEVEKDILFHTLPTEYKVSK